MFLQRKLGGESSVVCAAKGARTKGEMEMRTWVIYVDLFMALIGWLQFKKASPETSIHPEE